MKILLFCPTYKLANGELAIRNETLESISEIKVPEGDRKSTRLNSSHSA